MKVFSINSKELKYNQRLIPTFYYYNQFYKVANDSTFKSIRIGDIASVSDGEHSAIPRKKDSGIRYLYGRNIKEGIINFDIVSDLPFISENDFNLFKRCHISENDVLISILGTIGKSAIYKKEYVGIAGIPRHISNITLNENSVITPEFLSLYFRSKIGKKQMNSFVTGNIQKLFSLGNIKDFELLVPINDKNSILEKLTKIEKKALKCEIISHKFIDKAKKIFYDEINVNSNKKSKTLSFSVNFDEISNSNVWSPEKYNPVYVDTIRNYASKFNMLKLRDIVEMKHGDEVGSKSYIDYIEKNNNDIPFIRTSDIINGEIDNYPDYYVTADNNNILKKQSVRNRDVIFTKDGKIGSIGMITSADNSILSSGIELLRLKDNALKMGITQEYLYVSLAEPTVGLYGAKSRTVVSSTIPHLREENMKDIEIPIINSNKIKIISRKIRKAFKLKEIRKECLRESMLIFEDVFGH